MTTSFERLNSMEAFEFIAGTQYTLHFELFEDDISTPLDITGATLTVQVSYLGQPGTSLIISSGIITDAANGEWYAVLETADTLGLSGTYIVQPHITDFGGDSFVPAQARLVILPKIGAGWERGI